MIRSVATFLAALSVAVLLTAAAGAAAPPADAWLKAAAVLDRDALPRGEPFRVAIVLEIAPSYHINANPPSLDFQIPTVVAPDPAEGIDWGDVRYPAGEQLIASWAEGKPVGVYSDRTVIVVPATVDDDAPLGPVTLRLQLSYQGCDAATCYQPAERLIEVPATVVEAGTAVATTNAGLFRDDEARLARAAGPNGTAAGAPATPAKAGEPAPAAGPIKVEGQTDLAAAFEQNIFIYFGFLFLGGLLLNLTPCVFPLIPVTMTVFAQQGESRPMKVLPLALLYALGLAATFAGVGVLAALAGQSMGVAFQTPWGVLAIVAILAAMMASMFGAFEIQLPSGLMGRLSARRGYFGAAFMGMVMGAIAAPCVGPFLFALITFIAAKQSVPLGALSFFVTGLGIAAPYIFLGMFTSLINRVPRAGGWLLWTKQLMGLALGGLILYFVQPPRIHVTFFWPLVLAFAAFSAVYLGLLEGWSRRPFTPRFWAVRLIVAAAILGVGAWFYVEGTTERPEVQWQPWAPGIVEKAKADGRPVLLYFGADWCAECKVWRREVFTDPTVLKAADGLVRIYVDVTSLNDPRESAKKTFAEKFEAVNPPYVTLLGPGGQPLFAYRNPVPPSQFVEALGEAGGK